MSILPDTLADMVVAAAPAIPRPAARQFLHHTVVIIAGLYPVCFPAAIVRVALATAPELQCFRHDFALELRRLLRATLRDLVLDP